MATLVRKQCSVPGENVGWINMVVVEMEVSGPA